MREIGHVSSVGLRLHFPQIHSIYLFKGVGRWSSLVIRVCICSTPSKHCTEQYCKQQQAMRTALGFLSSHGTLHQIEAHFDFTWTNGLVRAKHADWLKWKGPMRTLLSIDKVTEKSQSALSLSLWRNASQSPQRYFSLGRALARPGLPRQLRYLWRLCERQIGLACRYS